MLVGTVLVAGLATGRFGLGLGALGLAEGRGLAFARVLGLLQRLGEPVQGSLLPLNQRLQLGDTRFQGTATGAVRS
jgi:hypothetical protein